MDGGTPDGFPFLHTCRDPFTLALLSSSLLHPQALCGQCVPLIVALKDRGASESGDGSPGWRAQPGKQRGGQRRGALEMEGVPQKEEGTEGYMGVPDGGEPVSVRALEGVKDSQRTGTLEEEEHGEQRRTLEGGGVSCMAERLSLEGWWCLRKEEGP